MLSRVSHSKRHIAFPHKTPDSQNGHEASGEQKAPPGQEGITSTVQNLPRVVCYSICRHPTFVAAALFVLMLSGPPRFRFRDIDASLHGETDWVVFFHISVWALAGFWVLVQIYKRTRANLPVLRLRLPQILGLILVFCLALSIFTSDAPSLTAFKVSQILVLFLFTQIFAEAFGARASLEVMLWGNAALCIAIAVCAFLAHDLVWTVSELDSHIPRLSGELIASTGVVSVFAIILLLTSVRSLWKPVPLLLFALFSTLLVLSLMRNAYVALLFFFTLVVLKRPNIKPLRRFVYSLCSFLLILYCCGLLPSVSQYRSPETITTLSDRTGLWQHLTEVTLKQSPWFGLGYYSASRIHGPEYNPLLGTAHSIFFEVLAGGGLISFALFMALCLTLSTYAVRLLCLKKDRISFAFAALFITCLLLGSMEETIDSGPVAIAFWCSVAMLPRLDKRPLKKNAFSTMAHAPLLQQTES